MERRVRIVTLTAVALATFLAVGVLAHLPQQTRDAKTYRIPPQEKPGSQVTAGQTADVWDPSAGLPDGCAEVPVLEPPEARASTSVLFASPAGGGPYLAPAPRREAPKRSNLAAITYWNNGDTDGTNGYSHAVASAFGYRRTVLDDFVVPGGQTWYVAEFQWLILWNTLPVGTGTGAEVIFRADAAGSPGAVVATASVTSYSEVATGRTWFGRAEGRATVEFDPVILPAGTYWVEWTPVGPENSFAMVRAAVAGSECWVDYADYGGLQPGSSVFSVPADLSFILGGFPCSDPLTINMTSLGGTTSDWAVAHGSETDRPYRDGVPSTCAAPKGACPGTIADGAHSYDAFSFHNASSSPACVTATLATPCTGTDFLFLQAYLGSFDPANICTNYLADIGSSPNGAPQAMSFTVPAGSDFVLVVNECYGGTCPGGYTLTLDGLPCAGACAGTLITGTYDNGPLVTHPGGGFGGADASALQSALSLNVYGFGHQYLNGYRMADDFTVTDPAGWDVDSIEFFAYQTGSTTASTITGVYYQIWDGDPSNPASSVVFGDLTTNRMTGTTWSNIYRVLDTSLASSNRPIMVSTASCGMHLAPGTYWLDWMTDGSLSSGPWAPPISILGQVTTGNALQYTGAWAPALDSGTGTQQGMPFLINWSVCGCPTITLSPASLPPTQVGLPYNQVLTAGGGTAPYVITYTGSLPPGLTFTDNGNGTATIAGTPTGAGAFDITVTATDSNACEGGQDYAAAAYSAHFEDDALPIIFCVDTVTGLYGWTPLGYNGRAEVMNGGAYIWNGPADPNFLYVVHDPVQHRAYGYYYDTGGSQFYSLYDSDTTNNVGVCP